MLPFIAVKVLTLWTLLSVADITVGLPVRNPWFDISVLLYIFSAITSGMPEPDEHSSLGYIWMFRTFHVLSANGTAYFIHRQQWAKISGSSA